MKGISVSASEEMVREQLDRIIAHSEVRVEQQCIHASSLAPYGDDAKKARSGLAMMLTGLEKLLLLRNEFTEPQPSPSGLRARGPSGLEMQDSSTHDDHKKPGAERDADPKTRLCLVCAAPFASEWAGERICRRCKSTAAWRSGALTSTRGSRRSHSK